MASVAIPGTLPGMPPYLTVTLICGDSYMLLRSLGSLALLGGLLAPQQSDHASKTATRDASEVPAYTADKQLRFPKEYREWVYLTSGMDMSYNAKEDGGDMHMFDNVFVNPASYREFLKSGTWPDGTTMVLENRGAVKGGASGASINKHGMTQSADVMGLEVHVKDATLPGGWGFFAFDNLNSAKLIARPATCYTCHEHHAAADTTFVQFYPTLLPVAKAKGTLSKEYVAESAAK
jgi:hypothetical protein